MPPSHPLDGAWQIIQLSLHNHSYLQVGEIEDVRLVTNYSGKSKGYAYVQFKDEVSFLKVVSGVCANFFLLLHCVF